MDYVKALTFITDDPRWKEKIGMATVVALLGFLLIPILFLMGYCVRLLQNVRDGRQLPLPEWDDWSGDLARGFKLFVVYLIWALPAILLALPITVGGIMLGVGADEESISALGALGGLTMSFGYCLIFLYGLVLAAATPGFNIWFARNEEIGEGLKVTEIWQWTVKHIGEVILFTLAYIVASMIFSMVASIVGTILCIVGLIVTIPLSMAVTYIYQYNLLGQMAYKDSTGQPYYVMSAPVAPPPAPAAPAAPATPPANVPPATGSDEPQI
jgi:hypothetical protein